MFRRLQTILITLAICVGAAWAGDVEDGNAALLRKDYATALIKLKQAAEKNNSYAQLQVGGMYDEGLGHQRTPVRSMYWRV